MANYSGLFDGQHGDAYELLSGHSPNRYHLMRLLRKRGMREYREIMTTLLEDVSGNESSTASATVSVVEATANTSSNVQGGSRTITTQQLIGAQQNSDKDDAAPTSRAVAAADTTKFQEEWSDAGDDRIRAPSNGSGTITYPADAAGNGGGGKFGEGS